MRAAVCVVVCVAVSVAVCVAVRVVRKQTRVGTGDGEKADVAACIEVLQYVK